MAALFDEFCIVCMMQWLEGLIWIQETRFKSLGGIQQNIGTVHMQLQTVVLHYITKSCMLPPPLTFH